MNEYDDYQRAGIRRKSYVIQVVESWVFIDKGINNHEVVLEKLTKKIYIRFTYDN